MPSVLIALPAFGRTMCVETANSLLLTVNALNEMRIGSSLFPYSYPLLSDLRNFFLTYWYDLTRDDYLLFVDADMNFDPAMIRDMVAFDKPLVGCVYPQKKYPMEIVGIPDASPPVIVNGFMRMTGIGCGAMLIRRDCVAKMLETIDIVDRASPEKYPGARGLVERGATRVLNAFDPIYTPTDVRIVEDLAFCYRHRELCGGEIWASVNHEIGHIGAHEFRMKYERPDPAPEA